MPRRPTRRRMLGLGAAAVSVALAGCGVPGGGEGDEEGEEDGEDGAEGGEEGRLDDEAVSAARPRRR